jgi:hypothetical protein
VEQYQFRVIRAGFREVGKILSNRSDQAGLSLHALVIGHRAMRIAGSGVDGGTREARIEAGRSRKSDAKKNR